MTITAHLDDTAVNSDFTITATITYTDGTGYSKQESLTADPNLTTPQLSALIKQSCAKHAAIAAKRTSYLAISNQGASKPYAAFVGTDVATFP